MKERPIIFSGPMVLAILEGRKTQTRRIVRPQPAEGEWIIEGLGHVTVGMNPGDDGSVWYVGDCVRPGREIRCPYGRLGDRLWVRETWWANGNATCTDQCAYRADGEMPEHMAGTRWRPSIHMPRWASRITLEIVGVKVERVQDISFKDCRAEGCDPAYVERVNRCEGVTDCDGIHRGEKWHFQRLWNSINAAKHPFSSNPWVWAIEFRRINP